MKQTRLVSAIEATVNVGTGFLLAMGIWQFIVPVFYPHLEPSVSENILMTTIFTAASITRGYLWRRFFNNGLHQEVSKWVSKLFARNVMERDTQSGEQWSFDSKSLKAVNDSFAPQPSATAASNATDGEFYQDRIDLWENEGGAIRPGAVIKTDNLRGPVNPKQIYGDKKLPIQWVPPAAICAMARGLGEGGRKYWPYNWRDNPVELLTYYGATMRHLLAWLDGEDVDPDSKEGKTHLDGAIASLAILIDAAESGYAIDNRPNKGAAPRMLLEGSQDVQKRK